MHVDPEGCSRVLSSTSVVTTPSLRVAEIQRATRRPPLRPNSVRYPLHLGEPDFDTPDYIKDAMYAAVAAGQTKYDSPQGNTELRTELAEWVSRRSAFDYDSNQIVVTAGGAAAVTASILATIDPGQRVLIPEPTYSLYSDAVLMAAGTPVAIPAGRGLRLDLEQIAQAAPGARAILLCNPCNPTGLIVHRDELERIAKVASEHDLLVLCDEAYSEIIFNASGWTSALELAALADRLIYCQTFSKTYAMTGWRIGFVAAPRPIAQAVALMHRTFNGPSNTAVQQAALVALRSGDRWPQERLLDYERRRKITVDALLTMPEVELVAPEGAFYVFPRIAGDRTSQQIVADAAAVGVGLRAGSEFGDAGERHVRIAFCVDDELLHLGLEVLRGVFARGRS